MRRPWMRSSSAWHAVMFACATSCGARLAERVDAADVVGVALRQDDVAGRRGGDRVEVALVRARLEPHAGVHDDAAVVGGDRGTSTTSRASTRSRSPCRSRPAPTRARPRRSRAGRARSRRARRDAARAGVRLRYSECSATAGRVRAALRAGTNAMRLTSTIAPAMVRSHRERRERRSGRDAEAVGDDSPHPAARDEPERDPDDEPDDGQRRGLPRDRRGHLPADEPDGLEQRELSSPSPYRGHQCVPDREQGERGEQRGERHREPVDLLEAVDLHRCCRTFGVERVVVECGFARRARRPSVLRRRGRRGRQPEEEVVRLVRPGVDERDEARGGECRAVGQRLRLPESREHDAADDPVVRAPLSARERERCRRRACARPRSVADPSAISPAVTRPRPATTSGSIAPRNDRKPHTITGGHRPGCSGCTRPRSRRCRRCLRSRSPVRRRKPSPRPFPPPS